MLKSIIFFCFTSCGIYHFLINKPLIWIFFSSMRWTIESIFKCLEAPSLLICSTMTDSGKCWFKRRAGFVTDRKCNWIDGSFYISIIGVVERFDVHENVRWYENYMPCKNLTHSRHITNFQNNQIPFFLERTSSELLTLHQTHLSRMNLSRKNCQKPTLATT